MRGEEQPIHEIVRQLETAWNSADSASFAAPFADDADFVDIRGDHHIGRTGIDHDHRWVFANLYRGSKVSYVIEGVRFVRSDVAIAYIHAQMELPHSDMTLHLQARPSVVLAKDDGQWRIVAFQNTGVAEAPALRAASAGL